MENLERSELALGSYYEISPIQHAKNLEILRTRESLSDLEYDYLKDAYRNCIDSSQEFELELANQIWDLVKEKGLVW